MEAEQSPAVLRQARSLGRKEQILEVLVFLFLIVPSMVLSFVAFQPERATFAFVAWSVMIRDIALVCLILFFIWRNNEPARVIGLTLKNGFVEAALGIALFIPFFYFAAGVERLARLAGLSSPSSSPSFLTPKGTADVILAVFLVIVVAISEETMFRGYLMRRLSASTGSVVVGLFLSAVVFSIGHGYEGSAGVVTVGVMGLIFGIVYLWRKSLIAPMTMHFLQDFIGIVLVPLLMLR